MKTRNKYWKYASYGLRMAILISHTSALQMLRRNPGLVLRAMASGCVAPSEVSVKLPRLEAERIASMYSLSLPLTIVVLSRTNKYQGKRFLRRVRKPPLPQGCAIQIEEELLLCSPAYVLALLQPKLSSAQLAMLACEFCGRYSIDDRAEGGFVQHEAFASVAGLRAFFEESELHRGFAAVKWTLEYVVDGSESPRETKLLLTLCFPRRLGGYGLPLPRLNHPVEVVDKNGVTRSLRCDFCWPERNLALEYDSDAFHTGADRIAKDSVRRDLLVGEGLTVLSATNGQVSDALEMDLLAETIRRRLQVRAWSLSAEWKARNDKLRIELGLPPRREEL